jgi:hypothetical protein
LEETLALREIKEKATPYAPNGLPHAIYYLIRPPEKILLQKNLPQNGVKALSF